MKLTSALDDHGKALELLSQRQKVLAGNIANADTPGFAARDFDFASALAAARGGEATGGLRATHVNHRAIGGGEPGTVSTTQLAWRTADQPALDGNTVDLDRERGHFADNAMRYEATLRFINHDVRTLLSAITGQ